MKSGFILILMLLSFNVLNGQGLYDANWRFGLKLGLDFTSGSPLAVTTSKMPTCEAAASISDSLGNLLIYTSGCRVWNRNNQLMPNGDSLYSGAYFYSMDSIGNSSTNGVVIIPDPANKQRFYIFNQWNNCWCGNPNLDAIGYSIVDMNLDGGLGDVVQGEKNIALQPYAVYTEKLAAVKHGNGRDWWLIAHDTSNNFIEWLITPDSIQGPFIKPISPHLTRPNSVLGEICVSKQGDKIGIACQSGAVYVYSFDRCNGDLQVLCPISDSYVQGSYCYTSGSLSCAFYGCSFSPDGNKFYYSSIDTLFQIDLDIDNQCSSQIIAIIDSLPNYYLGQHELAPDGKIYFSYGKIIFNDSSLNGEKFYVINSPNNSGLSCNVSNFNSDPMGQNYFINIGLNVLWSLPNMPNYNLGRLEGSACDTLYNGLNENLKNVNSIVRVYPNPASDELIIEVLNGVKLKEIEITNALGVTVMKLKQTKPNQQLNIKALAAGVYFIKVQMQNGEMQVKKFVKSE